jgi:hypothetical protein
MEDDGMSAKYSFLSNPELSVCNGFDFPHTSIYFTTGVSATFTRCIHSVVHTMSWLVLLTDR